MIDSDAHDDPKPLKFTTVPTWQAFMSPVPAQTADDIPEGSRAVPASVRPALDTSTWLRETTRIGGIRLSRSPTLLSRGDSSGWVQHYSGKEILVESWQGANCSFTLWIGPNGDYPISGYSPSAWPVAHDWTQSVETVHGTQMHLASFRLTRRDAAPAYHILAYWRVRDDMWARVAALSDTRAGQEHLLVMVRSAEAAPQDGVAV